MGIRHARASVRHTWVSARHIRERDRYTRASARHTQVKVCTRDHCRYLLTAKARLSYVCHRCGRCVRTPKKALAGGNLTGWPDTPDNSGACTWPLSARLFRHCLGADSGCRVHSGLDSGIEGWEWERRWEAVAHGPGVLTPCEKCA